MFKPAVLFELTRMFVRTRLEYPASMILAWVAQALSYGAMYAAIALIIDQFGGLGGWSWPEIALLLGFHLLSHSLGALFSFSQFRNLDELVRLGTLDAILVKPVPPWAYLVFSGVDLSFVGHIVLAISLTTWAFAALPLSWTVHSAAFFVLTLFSAATVACAIITMIGATAFVWVRSKHLFSIFFGFWELARYPINIFPGALQVILLTVVPLGYMSYVPVAVMLGKEVPLLGEWAAIASLCSGPVSVLFAIAHWRYCFRQYQGAGG